MTNQNSKGQKVQRKGFSLLELLAVMSIIVLLLGILLPCLMSAKERAWELAAIQVEINEFGEVLLEIQELSNRKSYEDIYMIMIDPPRNCRVSLQRPHPSGMKLIRRDGQDYVKWRPEPDDIGVHFITVVFEGKEISEQEITIFVFNMELLEAESEKESSAD